MSWSGRDHSGRFFEQRTTYPPSFAQKACGAVQGLCFGVLVLLSGVFVTFWNERRFVVDDGDINLISDSVIPVHGMFDQGNNGVPIYFSDTLKTTDGALSDPETNVMAEDIGLRRKAEIYQWVEQSHTEKHKNNDGSTTERKYYTYERRWTSSAVRSDSFHDPDARHRHQNPQGSHMPKDQTWYVSSATVGDFVMRQELFGKLDCWREYTRPSSKDPVPYGWEWRSVYLYKPLSQNNNNFDEIGDVRVKYQKCEAKNREISVLAAQTGNAITEWRSPDSGGIWILLKMGTYPLDAMIQMLREANASTLLVLRVVSWFIIFIGVMMALSIFSLILEIIRTILNPFCGLGNIAADAAGCMLCIMEMIIATAIWAVVTAIAWFVARPTVAMAIVVGGILLLFLMNLGKQKARTH